MNHSGSVIKERPISEKERAILFPSISCNLNFSQAAIECKGNFTKSVEIKKLFITRLPTKQFITQDNYIKVCYAAKQLAPIHISVNGIYCNLFKLQSTA